MVMVIKALQLSGLFFLFYLINAKKKLRTALETTEFLKKFGTFFEEFKEARTIFWLFYLIFIIRWCCLVALTNLLSDGIAQLKVAMAINSAVRAI